MLSYLSVVEWSRLGLLYGHLIACALAIAAVLKADVAIFSGQYTASGLKKTADDTSKLLLILWVTGLAIIYLDTGFEVDTLLDRTKLMLKLMCVLTLTANGLVLHWVSFPILVKRRGNLGWFEAFLLVTTGALSTTHWLAAAFVGMSKPLGRVPLDVLAQTYVSLVSVALVVSLFFMPTMRARLVHVDSIDSERNKTTLPEVC
ncbi:MAG: hypothetical protein ACPGSC_10600 [Granulosicoccaceae bacterium]